VPCSERHVAKSDWQYRLIDEYMPQPRLMKMRRNFIDKTCLSSDVASIAFAYFLNSVRRSLKYAIEFLLIQMNWTPREIGLIGVRNLADLLVPHLNQSIVIARSV
jgi:hypothetical protein